MNKNVTTDGSGEVDVTNTTPADQIGSVSSGVPINISQDGAAVESDVTNADSSGAAVRLDVTNTNPAAGRSDVTNTDPGMPRAMPADVTNTASAGSMRMVEKETISPDNDSAVVRSDVTNADLGLPEATTADVTNTVDDDIIGANEIESIPLERLRIDVTNTIHAEADKQEDSIEFDESNQDSSNENEADVYESDASSSVYSLNYQSPVEDEYDPNNSVDPALKHSTVLVGIDEEVKLDHELLQREKKQRRDEQRRKQAELTADEKEIADRLIAILYDVRVSRPLTDSSSSTFMINRRWKELNGFLEKYEKWLKKPSRTRGRRQKLNSTRRALLARGTAILNQIDYEVEQALIADAQATLASDTAAAAVANKEATTRTEVAAQNKTAPTQVAKKKRKRQRKDGGKYGFSEKWTKKQKATAAKGREKEAEKRFRHDAFGKNGSSEESDDSDEGESEDSPSTPTSTREWRETLRTASQVRSYPPPRSLGSNQSSRNANRDRSPSSHYGPQSSQRNEARNQRAPHGGRARGNARGNDRNQPFHTPDTTDRFGREVRRSSDSSSGTRYNDSRSNTNSQDDRSGIKFQNEKTQTNYPGRQVQRQGEWTATTNNSSSSSSSSSSASAPSDRDSGGYRTSHYDASRQQYPSVRNNQSSSSSSSGRDSSSSQARNRPWLEDNFTTERLEQWIDEVWSYRRNNRSDNIHDMISPDAWLSILDRGMGFDALTTSEARQGPVELFLIKSRNSIVDRHEAIDKLIAQIKTLFGAREKAETSLLLNDLTSRAAFAYDVNDQDAVFAATTGLRRILQGHREEVDRFNNDNISESQANLRREVIVQLVRLVGVDPANPAQDALRARVVNLMRETDGSLPLTPSRFQRLFIVALSKLQSTPLSTHTVGPPLQPVASTLVLQLPAGVSTVVQQLPIQGTTLLQPFQRITATTTTSSSSIGQKRGRSPSEGEVSEGEAPPLRPLLSSRTHKIKPRTDFTLKPGEEKCNVCGRIHRNFGLPDCKYQIHPDANLTNESWSDSEVGQVWAAAGFTCLQKRIRPDGESLDIDYTDPNAEPRGPRRRKRKRGRREE